MMNSQSDNINRLQYNYARIDLSTGECIGCRTYSYEIINDAYIPVPRASNIYLDKYYNRTTDLWYIDSEMTVEADDVNAVYHG